MAAYIVFFAITVFFAIIVDRVKSRSIKNIALVIVIIVPSLLAAVRSTSIGTDIITYVHPMYLIATYQPNFIDFLQSTFYRSYQFVPISSIEIGYSALVFLTTKIFGNLFSVLLITQLIITSFTFVGFIKIKNIQNFSFAIAVLFYLTFFYNLSLNMVRQSIAMALLVYTFHFLLEKKWLRSILLIFIASLFHKTAVIGFAMLLIAMVFECKQNNMSNKSRWLMLACITFVSFATVYVSQITSLVLRILNVSEYKSGYLTGEVSGAFNQLLIRVPFIIIFILLWKDNQNKSRRFLYLGFAIAEIALSQFATASTFASRIAYYFTIFYAVTLPTFLEESKGWKKYLLETILIWYLIFYWWYYTVHLNYNATYPFTTDVSFNFN